MLQIQMNSLCVVNVVLLRNAYRKVTNFVLQASIVWGARHQLTVHQTKFAVRISALHALATTLVLVLYPLQYVQLLAQATLHVSSVLMIPRAQGIRLKSTAHQRIHVWSVLRPASVRTGSVPTTLVLTVFRTLIVMSQGQRHRIATPRKIYARHVWMEFLGSVLWARIALMERV